MCLACRKTAHTVRARIDAIYDMAASKNYWIKLYQNENYFVYSFVICDLRSPNKFAQYKCLWLIFFVALLSSSINSMYAISGKWYTRAKASVVLVHCICSGKWEAKKKHVKNHIIFSLKWNNVTNRQKTSWHSKDECFTAHINRIKCVRASYGAVDLIPIFVAMSRHKCSNPCSKFVSCVLLIFFCSLAIFFPFGRRPIKMNRHKMKTLKILHRFTRTSTYFGHAHWGT